MDEPAERLALTAAAVQEVLAGLLNDAPVGVSVLNADSVFLYVNDAMAGLHGVAKGDHTGRPLHEVLPEVAPAISSAVEEALRYGRVTENIRVSAPWPQNPLTTGHWDMSIAPWRNFEGRVVGANVVARDVTAEVRMDEIRDRLSLEQAARLNEARSFSRALQEAMLTQLPELDGVDICARYLPAAADVAVGGDWYDAFVTASGATALVIGDVAGHDFNAAAGMGQLRGVLRAYAWDRDEEPGPLVQRLDVALPGLQVDLLATLVCGRIEGYDADGGGRIFRWTNAGHPPPLLRTPDGNVRLLDTEPDLLVGLDPSTRRATQQEVLPIGSTVLLYTDGLVERRGQDIDEGLTRLLSADAWRRDVGIDEAMDLLVEELADETADDDIALLAVRLTG